MYSIQWQLFAEIFVRKLTYASFCSIEFSCFFYWFGLFAFTFSAFFFFFFSLPHPFEHLTSFASSISWCQIHSFYVSHFCWCSFRCFFFVLFTKFSSFILIYCYLDTELFNFLLSIFCFFSFSCSHIWRPNPSPMTMPNGMRAASFCKTCFQGLYVSQPMACQSNKKNKIFPSKLSIRCSNADSCIRLSFTSFISWRLLWTPNFQCKRIATFHLLTKI